MFVVYYCIHSRYTKNIALYFVAVSQSIDVWTFPLTFVSQVHSIIVREPAVGLIKWLRPTCLKVYSNFKLLKNHNHRLRPTHSIPRKRHKVDIVQELMSNGGTSIYQVHFPIGIRYAQLRLRFSYIYIFIRFGSKLYRQTVGIPMGTNCAPLFADLFLICYEIDFMLSLSDNNQTDIIEAFNSTSRYLDDFLNIDNPYFEQMVGQIYPTKLQLNKANPSDTEASFLELNLSITNGKFSIS